MKLEDEQKTIIQQLGSSDSYNEPEKAKELNGKASSVARQLQERNYEWEIETEKLIQLDDT